MSDDLLAGRLATALGQLARRLRPERGELSLGHFSTLATLERHGPQRVGDLARAERVSAPVMTRIVAVLHDRGLVARGASPEDGRAVRVAITTAGSALVAEVRAERAASVAELLARLDPRELAALESGVEALEALAAQASPIAILG
jgi:DNA-binding MarR family transcriptional regulator